jgi:hypothetical protein
MIAMNKPIIWIILRFSSRSSQPKHDTSADNWKCWQSFQRQRDQEKKTTPKGKRNSGQRERIDSSASRGCT